MRVAFLNPMFGLDFTKSARWFARSRGRVQRHPDYLCIAAAVVEAAGHDVFFLDAQAKNLATRDFLPRLTDFAPDLAVYQASTPSIDSDIAAAALCKEATGCVNVLVGSHVSAESEDTLRRAGGAVDAVACGEYDYTIRDLAAGVPLGECAGLARLDGDAFVRNAPRPFIDNLDELPFPAWRHIDLADYRDAGKLFPFLTLITGRGCMGRCTFCQLPQVMNGHVYRTRSVENVIAEIEYDLSLFPDLKEIMFEDDTFTMRNRQDRLVALCEEMVRRKLPIAWSANARVDVNDLEVLKLMKRSGCRMLCVGFEFGDQGVLDRVRKGTTVDMMHRFADNARKAGIRVHGCFMIGGPGETRETAQKTIELARQLKIDTAQFSGVVAYP
ncbi:MAG: radical SAM protein, partial [Candidatus Hydrogenedentes bacterium]|nr:radical SAM protein [Candidatus Hydrogenedentota bacterium]